jgi:hypothetical protein
MPEDFWEWLVSFVLFPLPSLVRLAIQPQVNPVAQQISQAQQQLMLQQMQQQQLQQFTEQFMRLIPLTIMISLLPLFINLLTMPFKLIIREEGE